MLPVLPVLGSGALAVVFVMLDNSQKLVLKQIAERRMKEGRRCYRETRAVFYQLQRAAMSVDSSMTEDDFLREAKIELAKYVQK